MTDAELLEKVKAGLSVGGSYNDGHLMIKTLAVKGYMLNAGISLEQLESSLGIVTLTIGVMDIWNLSSGEVAFSPAFTMCLMPQLMAVSLPDV